MSQNEKFLGTNFHSENKVMGVKSDSPITKYPLRVYIGFVKKIFSDVTLAPDFKDCRQSHCARGRLARACVVY